MKKKRYPFIIRLRGQLYKIENFFGKWYVKRCNKNGKTIDRDNVVYIDKSRQIND